MSYHSKLDALYCECIKPKVELDEERKFPRYKCKVCDLFWKNPHYVFKKYVMDDEVDVKQ